MNVCLGYILQFSEEKPKKQIWKGLGETHISYLGIFSKILEITFCLFAKAVLATTLVLEVEI